MIVQRWTAPLSPSKEQLSILLENEGLEPFSESLPPNEKIIDHRHPFTEVRIILSGELLFNVAGNQMLLRQGDRIEIPANTKHAHTTQGAEPCLCICAHKLA